MLWTSFKHFSYFQVIYIFHRERKAITTPTDYVPAESNSSPTEGITATTISDLTITTCLEDSPAVSFEPLLPNPSTAQKSGSQPRPSGSVNSAMFDLYHTFQLKNFAFPKKKYGLQRRSFQPNWFELFPWLRYNEHDDSVVCLICAKQNAKGNLKLTTKKSIHL